MPKNSIKIIKTSATALIAVLLTSCLSLILPAPNLLSAGPARAAAVESATNTAVNADTDEVPSLTSVGAAVGNFWKLIWQKVWPAAKDVVSRFWILVKQTALVIIALLKGVVGSIHVSDYTIGTNSNAP